MRGRRSTFLFPLLLLLIALVRREEERWELTKRESTLLLFPAADAHAERKEKR